jgi:hypothetical protein
VVERTPALTELDSATVLSPFDSVMIAVLSLRFQATATPLG